MSLHLKALCDSIAGLTITGLTIKDVHQVNDQWTTRDTPVMFPEPASFISNISTTRDSYGSGAGNKAVSVTYTLTYRLCYSAVGTARVNFDIYEGLIDMWLAIVSKIIDNDALAGCVDITPKSPVIGPVSDPMGNIFHGADFAFDVLDYYEVA
jgi:hypothetical protein